MSGKVHSKAVEMWEDLPRSSRPSTSSTEVNIAKVQEIVTKNRHLSLRDIAAALSVSHESLRTILNDCFGMKRVAAGLIPKELNFLQKLNLVQAKNSTNIIEQPSYSLNIAPEKMFPFPKLKFRKMRLKTVLMIGLFLGIISEGAYFEGDKINFDE